MSKEWKCEDCVKYKTDACSTCACGYTPTVSCRDVLVDYDYAYQQGRADAIDEYNKKLNTSMDTLEEKLKDKEIRNLEDVTLSIRCGMNLLSEQLKSQN